MPCSPVTSVLPWPSAAPNRESMWASMLVALAIAGVAAYPLNRWLIARGKGHALAHAHH